MTLVIDASIACKWFFDEPGADLARTALLSGELLVAPELIVAEVANAAWKRVLRAEISIEQATLAVSGLELLDERVPLLALARRALAIGERLRHPTYDCFYLALAEQCEVHLLTDDHRLRQRSPAANGSRASRPAVKRAGDRAAPLSAPPPRLSPPRARQQRRRALRLPG
jgi:predicted nucleic acid-binding protein